uniref:NB-ARC domain-containing protein n=1 Tax=Salix viminalis TaxID=40686 RepID=A0A6N2KG87_SALVM
MHNQIEEIYSRHSVRCPNLSTLLRLIFEQLHGLKVLDVSKIAIKCLPYSVTDLVHLTSLLIKDCQRLSPVASLKKFRALKTLDLSRCST